MASGEGSSRSSLLGPLRSLTEGKRLAAETDFLIALFTDFGLEGPYTGQVKAVLHQAAPGIPVIDLLSDAPAGMPRPAAYLLAAYGAWFPPGTVFLTVIDPGVGSPRAPIIVEAEGRLYVGPDNGLFELVTRRAAAFRSWEILWRPDALSASFHGRDLFAPVAGRLARGERPSEIARPVEISRRADWPDDLAEVVYIDRYGNAITALRAACLPEDARFGVCGRTLRRARTFSDVPPGEAFWYENSNGLAEIAVNTGHAAKALGLAVGDPVAIIG